MRINRRDLLALSAAGAATMFLPDLRGKKRFARAATADTGPLLISIEAHAAWDPTFLIDPKTDPAFTRFLAADIRTVTGTQIRYAPSLTVDANDNVLTKNPYVVGADSQDFFQKHGTKLMVVNGVDNATVSHDIGPRVAFTGSNREGIPSIAGMVAAARGPTLPMSLMTTGGFVNTEGLVPITRAGNVNVLLGLARSNIPNFTAANSTRRFQDDGIFANLRQRVRDRDARRAAAASVPRELAGILRIEPARSADVFAEFDTLADALSQAQSVQSTNPVIPQAAAVIAAMAAGACVSAHLETSESFDTHTDHDTDHPVAMQNLLEIVDFVIDQVATYPNLMSRGVMIVVGSDFGRTRYNDDLGKDHWPVTSMMVGALGAASSLIQGGRVVGQTDTQLDGTTANGVIAKKVKLNAAGNDLVLSDNDSDIALSAGHVHLAVRNALGLSGVSGDLSSKYPLTAVVPQGVLPILKPFA
ncbi:MAG TPA: DUF1501 domain-containing protein [Myxococcota bacterium]|jgi:hypothetical protein